MEHPLVLRLVLLLTLLLGLLQGLCQPLRAQDHHLRVEAGLDRLLARDRQVGPLVHRADLLRAAMGYRTAGRTGAWDLSVAYGRGLLAPVQQGARTTLFRIWEWDGTVRDERIPIDVPMWKADLALRRTFHLDADSHGWSMGPGLRWTVQRPQGFAPVGQLSLASLDAVVERTWRWGRHALRTDLVLGLLPVITREPWSRSVSVPGNTGRVSSFFERGTRVDAPWRTVSVGLGARYTYRASDRWGVGLAIASAFLNDRPRSGQDRPAELRMHELHANITLHYLLKP